MKTILALMALALVSASDLASAQTVQAPAGSFEGVARGATEAFLGVPYAAAPVGPLRWRAPQPLAPWTQTRSADTLAPDCVQDIASNPPAPGYDHPQAEDCLYLNIWRPRETSGSPLPVMVWIHGGAFIMGSGALADYDGAALAAQGVILVNFNYRLGRFGTFAHPALAWEQAGQPLANYGLLDQIALLEWVKTNIAAFGGDPANVTVFGESAGASSVNFLMTSPLARGLFAKAISQSGGSSANLQPLSGGSTSAEAEGERWAAAKGVASDDLVALRALPTSAVLDAPVRAPVFPVLDGRVILASTDEAFATGLAAPLPYLVGANDHEQSLLRWLPGAAERMMTGFGDRGPALLALYQQPDESRASALDRMWGENAMVAPARARARAMAAAGAPVWLYRFSYVPEALRGTRPGAGHADEIEMVFDTPSALSRPGWSQRDQVMAALISGSWVSFARIGVPTPSGGAPWPSFTVEQDRLMEFSNEGPVVATDFGRARLDALDAAAAERR